MGKTTKYIKQQTTTHKQPYNIKSKQINIDKNKTVNKQQTYKQKQKLKNNNNK